MSAGQGIFMACIHRSLCPERSSVHTVSFWLLLSTIIRISRQLEKRL